jgi:phage protein U
MKELCSIGQAKLVVIGLNPQRIGTESEARVPGQATWSGMDYQSTGLGEARTRLEAVTYPHVIGGLDTLGWLQQHHQAQQVVNYYRLYPNFLGRMLGRVQIRHLFIDETRLHPFDGVGRRVGVELDLVYVGDSL